MTTSTKYAHLRQFITSLYTRKCRGCASSGVHNAHLTLLGRLHYTGTTRRAAYEFGAE